MRFFRNLPIGRKLTLITVLISGVALLLACGTFAVYEQAASRHQLARECAIFADMFDDNVASGLAFNDSAVMSQTLKSLDADDRILAAGIYDKTGGLVAHYQRADLKGGFDFPKAQGTGQNFRRDRLDTFKDIPLAGETIGTAYIATDLHELHARVWRYVIVVGALLLGCSLVALLLASRLQKLISQPIVDLAATAAIVATGKNYAVRATKYGDDEVGRLVDGFNAMLGQIQARDVELHAAQVTLEKRVEDRTKELAASISLLHATLESTADGIVAVDLAGKIISYNSKFAAIWHFPPGLLEQGVATEGRDFAAGLVKDSESFVRRTRELQAAPETESVDLVELKDGRVFERYVFPQRIKEKCVGSVINWRDVTVQRGAEQTLRESEEKFRQLADNITDVFWIRSPDMKTVHFISAGFELIWGRSRESLVANPHEWIDAIVPEDREQVAAAFAGLMGNQHSISVEYRIIRPDGTIRWIHSRGFKVRDATGKVVRLTGIVTDITDRKRAEEELRWKTALLEAQIDSYDVGTLVVDSSGLKILQNRRLNTLWKIPSDIAESSDDNLQVQYILTRIKDPARFAEKVTYLYSHPDESSSDEVELVDGTILDRYTAPVVGKDGRRYGRIWTFADITERKRAETQLAAIHQQLLAASRQAGMAEIATGVLHNVGNVLNSVNVSTTLVIDRVRHSKATNIANLAALFAEHKTDLADFLTSDSRGQMIPSYLSTLAESVTAEQTTAIAELESLRKNIDHIKDIVAMQQAHAGSSGVTATMPVAETIEDALRITGAALARHGVEIVRDFQSLPIITTDQHKVVQILVNLVRNAKLACVDSGHADKLITVRLTSDEHRVQIAVIDNGDGIPAENLTRIFNHGFTTRKAGHGFGLHSCALAAKELGGSIGVQSAGPGMGATFVLELPGEADATNHS